MWKKWVDWRIEFKVDNLNEEEIDAELRSGKAFWHKNDKKGNPVLVVKVKRHIPKESPIDQVIRFGVYLIEKGITEAEKSTGKLSVIWDREGFTMKNYDKRFWTLIKKFTAVLQDNYAERLDTFYILYPNWFFKTVYAVVKPFLSQRTKDKIVLINNVKDLMKHFEPECLIKEHGGTSSFVYKYKDAIFGEEEPSKVVEDNEEDPELKNLANQIIEENEMDKVE